jgi:formylglycine-generating enzyme required for sulfatase activity
MQPDPHATEHYLDTAVRFVPRSAAGADRFPPLRVATTLLTCKLAALLLNVLRLPAESGTTYRYVNVHNPRCPLVFGADTGRWTCLPAHDDHPVWCINWAGAQLLCRQLGARLPTAREWELFASNNVADRPYPWGDAEPDKTLANYDEHYGGTTRVGSLPPNELGLYDLAGNLGEWCEDRGAIGGFERVVKGGAWSKDASHLSIAAWRGKWARLGTTTIGVRPVWED